MSAPNTAVASRVLQQWRELMERKAVEHRLESWTLLAITCQESAGNTFAMRYEAGFMRTYLAGMVRIARATVSGRDDRWVRDWPWFMSSSFGLMQVMTQVALERGMLDLLAYPTELCDPDKGTEAGCRQLAYLYKRRGGIVLPSSGVIGPTTAALLAYNGGGAPAYPSEVLAWRTLLRSLAGA